MSKPIFVMEVPKNTTLQQCEIIRKTVQKALTDYNFIGIQSRTSDEFKYTILNGINTDLKPSFTGKDLEGVLKDIIEFNQNKKAKNKFWF